MAIFELLSGYFVCPSCSREFQLVRTPIEQAACPHCDMDLEVINDTEEEEEDSE